MAHAGLSDRGGRAQRLARLLLFDPRLLRREPRAGHDGRLRRLRRRGPPPRHAGPARLGGQPHGARRAVDRRKARLVVRTRRRGPSRRAVGLVRHRQTQLRRPRRVARAGRRHGVLAHAARRRRIPLRHGDAGSHRVLERDLAAPAACEARSVHAGRGRGAESFRGGGFRRLLRLADAPPDERRGPAAHPRHGPARLHLRRPRRLSRLGHAAGVHVEPRREFVERLRIFQIGRCARDHGGLHVRRAARPAADLHRAGDRLRPFVRLLRPRSDSPLRGQRFHRVLPPPHGVAPRQPGPGGGGAGRRDDRDPQQRRGLPDDAGPRDG